jgi:hypothetical protein
MPIKKGSWFWNVDHGARISEVGSQLSLVKTRVSLEIALVWAFWLPTTAFEG